MHRTATRGIALLWALAISCAGARAGVLDQILRGGIPIPIPRHWWNPSNTKCSAANAPNTAHGGDRFI